MQSLDVWRSLGLWVLCWLSASDVRWCSSKGSCVQWTLRTSDGDSKSSCFSLPSLGHPPAVHLVAFLCSVHPDSWLNCPVEPGFCVFICHKVTLDLQVLGLLPHPPHPRKKERREKKKMKEGKLPDGSSDSTLLLQDPTTAGLHFHVRACLPQGSLINHLMSTPSTQGLLTQFCGCVARGTTLCTSLHPGPYSFCTWLLKCSWHRFPEINHSARLCACKSVFHSAGCPPASGEKAIPTLWTQRCATLDWAWGKKRKS